ncbi:uncharacterized protein BDR25DRAFT_310840 [Lindgomyces ingoldianus]|uniref:Uncharacterized protein n=1 Tax=Lindgomyces ingoldianus TaxID=673940 RepID=A0ACB6RAI7_9PLEO|nr:uncharacterized protein BDR25DRAFT_310840 [Lindgomyces ingoldianus]KAF2475476.1 hypothetical protein BDR25DRAFT_310840 [Lindgomyces ingoldianus]
MKFIEETFDVLHKSLTFKWNDGEKYATANPFGDPRQFQYHTPWIFDTQNDVLRDTNCGGCSQIPPALFRERVVNISDMESIGGLVPLPFEPTFDSEMPSWDRNLTQILRCDFHTQWRHIPRNEYNPVTLRVLAKAIVLRSSPQHWGTWPQGVSLYTPRRDVFASLSWSLRWYALPDKLIPFNEAIVTTCFGNAFAEDVFARSSTRAVVEQEVLKRA